MRPTVDKNKRRADGFGQNKWLMNWRFCAIEEYRCRIIENVTEKDPRNLQSSKDHTGLSLIYDLK